jgi:hypothetical protein
MATYYDTKCLDCEYEFHSVYGRSGSSQKENKVVKSIEDGNRTDELALVYKTMERPRIEVNSVPFFCKHCRKLFNYDVTFICGKYGTYEEKVAHCPDCNEISYLPIPQTVFMKQEKESCCPCPKCNGSEFVVTKSGIYD